MSFEAYGRFWDFRGDIKSAVYKVGDDAEFQAKNQLAFLKSVGLKKSTKVLDLGCGCLRGALDLIQYLNKGCYTGVDVSKGLLDAGTQRAGNLMGEKNVCLALADSFDYGKAVDGKKYDIVFSNSVVTHLLPEDIEAYFKGVAGLLSKKGKFYFTMYPLPDHVPGNSRGNIGLISFKKEFLIEKAKKAGLDVTDIEGEFANPKPSNKVIDKVNTPYLGQWVMKGELCKKQ